MTPIFLIRCKVGMLALFMLAASQLTWAAASADKKRVAAARAQADADLAAQEAECQQRFAVTPCILEAREKHRAIVEPLRRDELVIDERERKQRGADRLEHLKRKAEAAREAASAAAAAPTTSAPDSGPTTGAPALPIRSRLRSPSASSPPEAGAASTVEQTPEEAQTRRAHASKRLGPAPDPRAVQRAEARVKQAEERRARVLSRNAERDAKNPPAAPLPVPEAPAASSPAVLR